MPRISCGADMKSRAAIRRSHRSRIKPRETARTTLNESRTDQFRLRVARARRTKPATDINHHPVLGVEAQKGKVFDQKMQRFWAPFSGQKRCFACARQAEATGLMLQYPREWI